MTARIIPQRWIIVMISSFALLYLYAMRSFLPITMTQMTGAVNNASKYANSICLFNEDPMMFRDLPENMTISIDGHFHWTAHIQGVILSSYYWTYLVTNLLGDLVVRKIGSKQTLNYSILISVILMLVTPISVTLGDYTALIFLRAMTGIAGGVVMPAVAVLLARWIPLSERSTATTLAIAGATLGNVFGMVVPGYILEYVQDGWPIVFYFFGISGVLFFVINCIFCSNKPSQNPSAPAADDKWSQGKLECDHTDSPPTPWQSILTSKPVWALILMETSSTWGLTILSTGVPKYMDSILRFSVKDNGLFSSLPYLCMWICGFISAAISDWQIAKGKLDVTTARKTFATISSLGLSVFIVAASFAGCNRYLAVILITIGFMMNGCSYCSIKVNAWDLGPNYVGALSGVTNGISTLSGIVAPYLIGVLTSHQTISEWQFIFCITFAIFVVSNIVFLVFGSGEPQIWNDSRKVNEDTDKVERV
ncbi:hypothetical protein QAD02_009927 [Eretmocerus hayati]|uniref:Uncharacterized protein n=1 Tax=Eretmocerus hayati TaxID=131215 RepID=A0ACC2NB32_9HYME|nr:hypothetical protein QAD02_009927 [Eretmocerus hayati]